MRGLGLAVLAVLSLSAHSVDAADRPYMARVHCSYPGGELPYYACMRKMRLRIDGRVRNFELHQVQQEFETRGNVLMVGLSESFELRIQNSNKSDGIYLDVSIENGDGTVLYQDQVGRWEVVAVRN